MVAEAYFLDCHKVMLPSGSYYSPPHFPLFHPKGGMGEEKEKNRWWDPPLFFPFPPPPPWLPGPHIPTHPHRSPGPIPRPHPHMSPGPVPTHPPLLGPHASWPWVLSTVSAATHLCRQWAWPPPAPEGPRPQPSGAFRGELTEGSEGKRAGALLFPTGTPAQCFSVFHRFYARVCLRKRESTSGGWARRERARLTPAEQTSQGFLVAAPDLAPPSLTWSPRPHP